MCYTCEGQVDILQLHVYQLPLTFMCVSLSVPLIVEIREQLESASSVDELTTFARDNQRALTRLYRDIEEAVQKHDVETMTQLVIKLSYLHNVEAEIYKKMPVQ